MSKGFFTGADIKAQQKEENNTKMNGMQKLLSDELPVKKDPSPEEIVAQKDMLKDPKIMATCAAVASRRASR